QLAKWLTSRFSAELTRRRLVLEEAVSRVFAMKMAARSRPPPASMLNAVTTEDIVRPVVGPDLEDEPDDITEMTYIEADDELPTELRAAEQSVPAAKAVRSVMPPRASFQPPSFQPPPEPSFVPPRPSRAPPPRTAAESSKLPQLSPPQLTGSYPSIEALEARRSQKPAKAKGGSGFLWVVLVVLLLALVAVVTLLALGSLPFL
ncbi:MAG: hypothetical protein JWM74_3846, partial [Myxococcaceae bacterium]|nr:hypothetical protein [Myxococcaceae bacterium]